MKYAARMFSLVICVVMVATMFSFAPGVFAAESGEEPAEYQISVIPRNRFCRSGNGNGRDCCKGCQSDCYAGQRLWRFLY